MDKNELLNHLDEQLYFLQKSINDYDQNEIEAKRAATIIRTLVHDTQNSTSLLNMLNAKNIEFIDTNAPKNAFANWKLSGVGMTGGNIFLQNTPYVGLVGKELTGSPDGIIISYTPIYKNWDKVDRKIDFNSWWNAEIYDNRSGDSLSRKGLVLNIANKDGGAHIDNLTKQYSSFKTANVLQFKVDGNLQGFDNIPAYPAVMQIAWELLYSIKDELANIKK